MLSLLNAFMRTLEEFFSVFFIDWWFEDQDTEIDYEENLGGEATPSKKKED